MKSIDLLKLQKRARHAAIKAGFGEDADDFAQEVAIRALKGNGVKLSWAVSSFLRKEQGDPRTHCGRIRKAQRLRTIRLDAPINDQDGNSELRHELIGSTRRDPEPSGDLEQASRLFRGRQAIIFDLKFRDCWSYREIADYMDLEVNYVNQIIHQMRRRIRLDSIKERLTEALEETPTLLESEMGWVKW